MAKPRSLRSAFDQRIAVGLIGSSGEGGVKLHRHIYGEAVENLAGGEYYWMAGNFIKYGASDSPMTAADLPVDSHELIAYSVSRARASSVMALSNMAMPNGSTPTAAS